MKLSCALLLICFVTPGSGTLDPRTLAAWESYIEGAERRIDAELANPAARLDVAESNGRAVDVSGGMIHDWRGATFVPGITLDALLRWLQDYDHHAGLFKNVEQSKLLTRSGDTFCVYLRLKRTRIVTVRYNTEHKAVYRRDGPGRASSRSFATKIAEVENAGTRFEREKPIGSDNGYLWRLNSYWRFQEKDGGVIVECESISLSRSLPFGIGWLVGGYAESIAKESLEETLTSIRDGVPHNR